MAAVGLTKVFNVLGSVLDSLVGYLPEKFQPAAKVAVPSVVTLVAIGYQWYTTKVFDEAELWTAIGGLATAIGTYATPNKPKLPAGE